MAPTVLAISEATDATADLVVDALRKRESVRVVRFDVADFPLRVSLGVTGPPWTGVIETPDGSVTLDSVCGVLYRRPTQYRFPPMSPANRQFAAGEARLGFGGILANLGCRWVNHPARVADAEYKPAQLATAHTCGLVTPRTLITNRPDAARAFAEQIDGPVVYKPLTSTSLERGGSAIVVYTTVVDPDHLTDPAIGYTAHVFQEWVPKAYELRVNVVGPECFAVAIDTDSPAAKVDWRTDYGSLAYRPVLLPDELCSQLRRYLDMFELTFGAFDLVVTPAGEHFFLECNPNGQWGWLEEETGLPIAAAMAGYLAGD